MRNQFLTLLLTIALGVQAHSLPPRWGDTWWTDSVPMSMRQSYISFGEQYRGHEWKSLPVSVFAEFKKTGNRTRYESLMFEKRRQLAALVMAEIVEGKRRFMSDIVNGLLSTLEETWWGLPAHYKTEIPRSDDQTVDLFNAETAALLAYTRYVLSDEIDHFSPFLTRRIDAEIVRRILQPAIKTKYWWKTAGMNWNPWICSNWMACILFCEHDEKRRSEAIRQIESACDAFMQAYPADGGCDEGPHYWDRAAASLFETLYLLEQVTEHGVRSDRFQGILGSQPSLHSSLAAHLSAMESYIYKMYIGNDYAVNFADSHGNRAMLSINIAYPFGLLTRDQTMRQYAAYVGRKADILHQCAQLYDKSGNWPSLGRELIFLSHIRAYLQEIPQEPRLRHTWLPDLQIMTAREPYVAFKGGTNGESHNHNDVGSFIVYPDGQPLLIDPGVGEYTSKTFSKQRYDIWTMQSDYHNVPRINGCSQHDGKQYHATVVAHRPGQLTLDIARAYPKEAQVSYWRRTVTTGSRGRVDVTEDYGLGAYIAPTQLTFVTPFEPHVIKDGSIAIGTHQLTYDAKMLEPQVEDISHLLDAVTQEMWGQHLYRLTLTVRSHSLKGKIKYSIAGR